MPGISSSAEETFTASRSRFRASVKRDVSDLARNFAERGHRIRVPAETDGRME